MTNYHVFLCIVGLLAVVYGVVSIRDAFRSGTTEVGDDLITQGVHRAKRPFQFWLEVVAKIIGVAVLLAAIVISIFTRR